MQPVGRFRLPASHPSLPGHFPGRPIVPGVVLLDEALACLPPGLVLMSAKFIAPVGAEAMVEVSSSTGPDGRVSFECTSGGQAVLHGRAGRVP